MWAKNNPMFFFSLCAQKNTVKPYLLKSNKKCIGGWIWGNADVTFKVGIKKCWLLLIGWVGESKKVIHYKLLYWWGGINHEIYLELKICFSCQKLFFHFIKRSKTCWCKFPFPFDKNSSQGSWGTTLDQFNHPSKWGPSKWMIKQWFFCIL